MLNRYSRVVYYDGRILFKGLIVGFNNYYGYKEYKVRLTDSSSGNYKKGEFVYLPVSSKNKFIKVY